MAEKLDNYDFAPKSKYPWDQWLDGSVWKILEGEDFQIKPESFQVKIYEMAKKRGLKARVSRGDGFLIFQAYEPPPS